MVEGDLSLALMEQPIKGHQSNYPYSMYTNRVTQVMIFAKHTNYNVETTVDGTHTDNSHELQLALHNLEIAQSRKIYIQF